MIYYFKNLLAMKESYTKFKKTISEVVDIFYLNIKSVIVTKINIFDQEEYDKLKKDIKSGKISGNIVKEKNDMYEEYITFVNNL